MCRNCASYVDRERSSFYILSGNRVRQLSTNGYLFFLHALHHGLFIPRLCSSVGPCKEHTYYQLEDNQCDSNAPPTNQTHWRPLSLCFETKYLRCIPWTKVHTQRRQQINNYQ